MSSDCKSYHVTSKVIYCDDLVSHIFIEMIDKKSCLAILLVCRRFNELYRLRVPGAIEAYVKQCCDRIELLEWAIRLGAPTRYLCGYCCGGGHLSTLQWLRSQEPPCPWNKWSPR